MRVRAGQDAFTRLTFLYHTLPPEGQKTKGRSSNGGRLSSSCVAVMRQCFHARYGPSRSLRVRRVQPLELARPETCTVPFVLRLRVSSCFTVRLADFIGERSEKQNVCMRFSLLFFVVA